MSWRKSRKYKTFSIPIEKEVTKVDKDGNESVVTISYTINVTDSARFTAIHYQILLIILQKEFIKLNAKIAIAFLNVTLSRTIQ